jgi:hypothetical protein
MDGLASLVLFFSLLIFGVPVILFIVGLLRLRTNKDSAKNLFIFAAVWLIVGGGICAALVMG